MTNSIRIGKKSNRDRIFFSLGAGTLIPHRGFPSSFSLRKKKNQQTGHKVLGRLCSHDLN